MKNLINRMIAIICLPAALLWWVFYKLTGNKKELLHYTQFTMFIIETIKIGKFTGPNDKKVHRLYP